MKNGWTNERRAKQALAIKRWKPWEASTGPRSDAGKAASSGNAWKGGKRPKLRTIQRKIAAIFAELQQMEPHAHQTRKSHPPRHHAARRSER
jgi:hypothetical protein